MGLRCWCFCILCWVFIFHFTHIFMAVGVSNFNALFIHLFMSFISLFLITAFDLTFHFFVIEVRLFFPRSHVTLPLLFYSPLFFTYQCYFFFYCPPFLFVTVIFMLLCTLLRWQNMSPGGARQYYDDNDIRHLHSTNSSPRYVKNLVKSNATNMYEYPMDHAGQV